MFFILALANLILGAVLLIDSLRRKHLYPVFDTKWLNRAFWVATLVLFNPILMALYVVAQFLARKGRL